MIVRYVEALLVQSIVSFRKSVPELEKTISKLCYEERTVNFVISDLVFDKNLNFQYQEQILEKSDNAMR